MQGDLLKSEFDWKFRAESDTACLSYSTGCLRPRGKMLGGTSAINSMLYVRGHQYDFDQWSEYGNTGWDYESVLKYFKKSENNQNEDFVQYKNGAFHSDKGPMKVGYFGGENPFHQVYFDAIKELGLEVIDDVNADKVFGVTKIQANVWKGRRDSTAKAFLIPARDRKNLHIMYNAEAQKILIDENNRATGVEFVYKNEHTMQALTTKEVVLSAGSIMSPKILMLSGIGPKEHLHAHGISVKSDLPVGHNLMEHIFARLFFTFKPNETIDPLCAQLDEIYQYAIHNSGPLAYGHQVQFTGFINSMNHTEYPDVQVSYMHYPRHSDIQKSVLAGFNPKIKEFFLEKMEHNEVGFIFIELVQPKSRGYIQLKSSSHSDKPVMKPNYLTSEEDVEAILRSIKRILPIINTKTFKGSGAELLHLPIKECDNFEYLSDEYWRCYIYRIGYPTNHSVGTSKMGPDSDPKSVVDPRLRVRKVTGLRQIDGGM